MGSIIHSLDFYAELDERREERRERRRRRDPIVWEPRPERAPTAAKVEASKAPRVTAFDHLLADDFDQNASG